MLKYTNYCFIADFDYENQPTLLSRAFEEAESLSDQLHFFNNLALLHKGKLLKVLIQLNRTQRPPEQETQRDSQADSQLLQRGNNKQKSKAKGKEKKKAAQGLRESSARPTTSRTTSRKRTLGSRLVKPS